MLESAMMKTIYPEKLEVKSGDFPVKYLKVNGVRSTVRITKGTVMVSLSRYLLAFERDKIVRRFLKWAIKRLEKVERGAILLPEYVDGGRIVTHNKIYYLKIVEMEIKNPKITLDDFDQINLVLPLEMGKSERKELIRFQVEKIIMKDQHSYLKEVIDELNHLYFVETYNLCRFKRTNSRFGSCSSKRNINIALRLLFAPRAVFRYVCVHELAHLREFNHSKRFWDLVEMADPDYKESEKWLKKNGFLLG